jgi:uncharacterized protein
MILVATRVPPGKATVTDVERAGDGPAPRRSPLSAPGWPTAPADATDPDATNQGDLGVRWQRPSPRLLRARRLEVVLVTGPLALAGGLIAGFAGSLVLGLGVGLALLVAGLLSERFLARRVAAWGYAERNDDLMVRRGVLIRRQSVIPYGRMQFIDVTAGPVERSLGLATLRMHTAAAASDARIPGLDRAAAARLRDQLASLGEARAAGL